MDWDHAKKCWVGTVDTHRRCLFVHLTDSDVSRDVVDSVIVLPTADNCHHDQA